MRAVNAINYSRNYFNGFGDVCNRKTTTQALVGLLKILSYALILPPVIFRCMYFKNKKINDLQTDIDGKIDSNRMQEIFLQTVVKGKAQENGQKKLIKYLTNKLVNFEKGDDEELERSRFEKGFKQLSFESQGEFFKRAHAFNCLGSALRWMPKDIAELNFISGPPNAIYCSKINRRNVASFLEELPKFTHLKKIELNLKGLGFYTPSIDRNVQTMAIKGISFAHSDEGSEQTFNVHGILYTHYNDTLPIVKIIIAMKALIQRYPDLTWQVVLMNFGIGGKGVELQSVVNGEMRYTTNLTAYFRKNGV